MRSEQEANQAIECYADTVRRISFIYLKNEHDVEDVFQEVFMKYVLHDAPFESDEHEKAWLIRIAINACKDSLKTFFRKKVKSIDVLHSEPSYLLPQDQEVLDIVLRLPEGYRNAIYLFYYEGYSAGEIARILNKKTNTIYTWLSRAKQQLRNELGGELFAE